MFRVENKVINIAFSPIVVNAVDKHDAYSLSTEGKTKLILRKSRIFAYVPISYSFFFFGVFIQWNNHVFEIVVNC